jgi:hypothetical protein
MIFKLTTHPFVSVRLCLLWYRMQAHLETPAAASLQSRLRPHQSGGGP